MSGRADSALALARAVTSGTARAAEITTLALARVESLGRELNSFTDVLADEAIRAAETIDARIARGKPVGALAGVPIAVKNLFDVRGLTTRAGSIIENANPPATRDATVLARLREAGAILVGATNMDEYAYGFTTENSHYGPTRNPWDTSRVAGGSSGGSAAAVAAGIVPLALGSDTNGSIRVPASFTGIFGLKPTYGRLSRRGAFLFAPSLDHVGPFARTVADLALAYDIMQGPDGDDPVCRQHAAAPVSADLEAGIDDLKIAVAGGYYESRETPEARAAVATVAEALGVSRRITLPEPERARAAAVLITASEGADQHLENLRLRAADFDPLTRDRFLAGALMPTSWYLRAQRFRRRYQGRVERVFEEVDIILAPATPVTAPEIGQQSITLGGIEMPSRPNLGYFTQPLTLIGLPIVSVPLMARNGMPMGVQVIARPWAEAEALRVARQIEAAGVTIKPTLEPH